MRCEEKAEQRRERERSVRNVRKKETVNSDSSLFATAEVAKVVTS
jgi:hypothetical protein